MNKITENDFYRLLCNCYIYFGKQKLPKKDRSLSLYNKINYLTLNDINKAFVMIEDDYDNMPANIPKALKRLVYEIKAQKPGYDPDSFTPHKLGHCDDCNGCGIFRLRYVVKGVVYEPIAYCSSCQNWRQWVNDPGRRVSKGELINKGIMHKPFTVAVDSEYFKNIINDEYNPETVEQDLKQLASGILKGIE